MASTAKAYKWAGMDSGYRRDFGQKKKRCSGGKVVKEEVVDKSKDKRKCYNCISTQHLFWSCPKNEAEIVFLCLGFYLF